MAERRSRLEKQILTAVFGAGALAVAVVAGLITFGPYALLFEDVRAPWMTADTAPHIRVQQWGQMVVPATRFSTSFEIDRSVASARFSVRALQSFKAYLNGTPIGPPPSRAPGGSKRFTELDVSGLVRPGVNRIGVVVQNPRGPALLSLALEAPGVNVASGTGWTATLRDGTERPTLIADDRRPLASSAESEAPAASLAGQWRTLLVLALLSAVGFALLQREMKRPDPERSIQAFVLGAIALAWVTLFLFGFNRIPMETGFDVLGHLAYLDEIALRGRVPLAAEGWSLYHPPLFYALSAGAAKLAEAVSFNVPFALKLTPFLSGLGIVWLASVLVRRLLPGDLPAWIFAMLFAASLPMNIYIAAYFSNESTHAFLAAAGLVVAVGLLLDAELSTRRIALFSGLAGCALLTKFTGLVMLAPAAVAIGLRIVAERGDRAVVARRVTALILPLLLICGWFYARNIVEYGKPIVGNWALEDPSRTWWSPPGFHTPTYYLAFGQALLHPYHTGFSSFWDALYSTLWGDGFLAGTTEVWYRHEHWNYELMSAGYALALPATLALVAGLFLTLRAALLDPEPRRRAAFGLVGVAFGAIGLAIFWGSIVNPFFGQAKSFYGLATAPVLAVFFATTARSIDTALERRGWRPARAVLFVWVGIQSGVFFLSYL